jgi:CheY-like chemotaxis protein
MSDGLHLIIVDDDPMMCKLLSEMIGRSYSWGEVTAFTDPMEAVSYCQSQETGVAIFVLDVFLEHTTGFNFLDAVVNKFPMAYEDTIIITGNASDDVVNMCVASDVTYLLEKPIKPYALQFAIRAIVAKYIRFAKRLLVDPLFAESVARV